MTKRARGRGNEHLRLEEGVALEDVARSSRRELAELEEGVAPTKTATLAAEEGVTPETRTALAPTTAAKLNFLFTCNRHYL